MSPRVVFPNKVLPYLLVAPQLAITLVFFYWPASQAIRQSMLKEDPFGLKSKFVWFDNFERVLSDPNYCQFDPGHRDLLRLDGGALDVGGAAAGGDGRARGARQRLLPHADDLALRRRAGHRRHALPVPVPSLARQYRLPVAANGDIDWDPLLDGQPGDGPGHRAPPPGSRSATISCSSSPGCRRSRNR